MVQGRSWRGGVEGERGGGVQGGRGAGGGVKRERLRLLSHHWMTNLYDIPHDSRDDLV